MRSSLPLAAVLLVAVPFAVTADARPARPVPAPPNLTIAPGGDARVTDLARTHASALLACAPRSPIKATLRASFDHRGRARQLIVRSDGGRAFERCVESALRGQRSLRRGASGPRAIAFVIDAAPGMPVPLPTPIKPAPSAPTAASLQACEVDSDCTIHFRTHGCFPADPIAVSSRDPAAVRTMFPVTSMACAMGGPQYERQRMANEGRYGAVCTLDRCEVVDRGPRRTFPF